MRRSGEKFGKILDVILMDLHLDGGSRAGAGAFDLDNALAVLERTPGALRALLTGLPEAWLRVDEGPRTFTPVDIVAHLLHGERTDWLPRVRHILAEGDRVPFVPFEREAHRALLRGESVESLLDAFARERGQGLAALRDLRLSEDDLARPGLHPALGRVTLRMLLATWVVHDLGHLRQAARVMAGAYRGEVGPWEAYLPVLHER
jgi:hypothetical protein